MPESDNTWFVLLIHEEGTIDPELREAITAAILGVKSVPGMTRYWRQRRSYLHSGFAKYVDELLMRATDVSVDIYRSWTDEQDRE